MPAGNSGQGGSEFLEHPQPTVNSATGGLGPAASHQRVDLMSGARAGGRTPDGLADQYVYRTRALGTIAEVVTDAGAIVTASEMLERSSNA